MAFIQCVPQRVPQSVPQGTHCLRDKAKSDLIVATLDKDMTKKELL
jgi:hypothetical protein